MNAPTTITAAFTKAEADAIIAACESELDRKRARADTKPWNIADLRHSILDLHGIIGAATEVLDNLAGHEGFDDAHDMLVVALQEADNHAIWTALAKAEQPLPYRRVA